ncbi:MAG TPA: maleylpyruvate isomerase N-terminal domain-containing protein [Streptosporangiaceae bacterium]|nr:maleylpyruvate isomerase N-terminal domain-containing protein [Streptosporangiaceae bacterium]
MNEITRTGWDVLDEARAALRATVAGMPADSWRRATPCAEWDATQVLQHAALDQGAWAAVVSGSQPSGENPFAPSGRLDGAPLAYVEAALDAAIHAWDIAMGTGQASPLTSGLARALTPVAKSIVEPLRQYGVYAAALEPGAGADDAATLLNYLGRSPAWSA